MCNIVKPVLQLFILLNNCVPKVIYITTCRQFETVLPPHTHIPQPSLGYRKLVLIKIQLLLTIWRLTEALRTIWDETFLMLGYNDGWKLTNSSDGIESDTSLHDQHIFFIWYTCMHLASSNCWPSPSNQSFYRQIAGYQRGVGDHRVGQWWEGSWANKIVAWP